MKVIKAVVLHVLLAVVVIVVGFAAGVVLGKVAPPRKSSLEARPGAVLASCPRPPLDLARMIGAQPT